VVPQAPFIDLPTANAVAAVWCTEVNALKQMMELMSSLFRPRRHFALTRSSAEAEDRHTSRWGSAGAPRWACWRNLRFTPFVRSLVFATLDVNQ
jgi:hypothetical protein